MCTCVSMLMHAHTDSHLKVKIFKINKLGGGIVEQECVPWGEICPFSLLQADSMACTFWALPSNPLCALLLLSSPLRKKGNAFKFLQQRIPSLFCSCNFTGTDALKISLLFQALCRSILFPLSKKIALSLREILFLSVRIGLFFLFHSHGKELWKVTEALAP